MDDKKHCPYCDQSKLVDEFPKRKDSPDGRRNKCGDCVSNYMRRYVIENRAYKNASCLAWVDKNRDKRKEIQKRYRENNVASIKAITHNRRARCNGPSGVISKKQIASLMRRAKGVCVYCGCEARLTVDHVTALSRGGEHRISNLLPCCKSCNSSKNASEVTDWLERKHGVVGLASVIMFMERQPDWLQKLRGIQANGKAQRAGIPT